MVRQGAQVRALAHGPHHERRVEIISSDAVACVSKTPMAEGAHDLAGGFARRGQPVFTAQAVRAGSFLDDSLLFQLPQSFDEQCARHQRHAAGDIIEGVGAEQQLAHDERRPSRGEDFGRLGHRTELAVAALHVGDAHGGHVADICCRAIQALLQPAHQFRN